MNIDVLLFAGLAENAGDSKISLSFADEQVNVQAVRNELKNLLPNMEDLIEKSMVAVNQEYATNDVILSVGDEIALIPPVSGG
ncbi:molybdopterin converting factor subunit 1 [Ammoniphilus resinae]|uniref:Molybdopterin synthase sulfur carrier subunit n=1 Tax=Ammoniphilus resinae TaxID=861532 RepID=A0ABS4GUJ3_9BACL|nr:molybdopterin converting factor subunit 1 [Ammoniphilus resinae]MBP1933936.1 molybdopterin converting factor subunit 1 [Ammoniphilus resinae]